MVAYRPRETCRSGAGRLEVEAEPIEELHALRSTGASIAQSVRAALVRQVGLRRAADDYFGAPLRKKRSLSAAIACAGRATATRGRTTRTISVTPGRASPRVYAERRPSPRDGSSLLHRVLVKRGMSALSARAAPPAAVHARTQLSLVVPAASSPTHATSQHTPDRDDDSNEDKERKDERCSPSPGDPEGEPYS